MGPTQLVDWGNLNNIPSDIADGDDDTLASLSCNVGQIVGWNGVNWICTDDNGLTEAQVEGFIENDPINLAAGSQMGGLNLLTTADIGDTLSDLSCQIGESPQWDPVSGWVCGSDLVLSESDVETYVSNGPMDFMSGSTVNGRDIMTAISVNKVKSSHGTLPTVSGNAPVFKPYSMQTAMPYSPGTTAMTMTPSRFKCQ